MHYIAVFVLLLTFVFGLGLLARRIRVPYPILFVLGGLLIGFMPHLPRLTLDPDFIFFIFLPPILYFQAFNTSWRDFTREIRPILLLAVGLVVITTVVVAFFAHWMIPDFPAGSGAFPLAAGFVLGAIISPPDAIAAAAIAQRLGLPRRIITILEGESLVNDATSLVIFQMALTVIMKPGTAFFGGVWQFGTFTYVALGGICVGVAIGWIVANVQKWVMNDGPEIVLTVSLLTPFISYLAGMMVHASSVLAVVATGLYLGRRSSEWGPSEARLRSQAVWEMIVYLLNGMVFVLIGLQLPGILHSMREHWWPRPYLYGVAVTLVCIAIRLLWVMPSALFPWLYSGPERVPKTRLEWKPVFIVGWAGMRGVVSLAAALALNGIPQFPRSHLVQFIAFNVILGTLVFQGLTLPFFIRRLGLADDGSAGREEMHARRCVVEAVLARIAEARSEQKYPETVLDEIEHFYREHAPVRVRDANDKGPDLDHSGSMRRLQHVMLVTGHSTLVALRHEGHIGDDVLHKIEHELDLEEARLRV